MAESYRGLTIKIGGDTTGLQKALKTSTSAISGADMELRKLGQALKLDPGNIEAYSLQIGYMGDKATSTAMKLYQMQQAAEQIRNTPLEFDDEGNVTQTLGEVAELTNNVHLNAEKAKASYNQIRDELHGMYETLTQYNTRAVKEKLGAEFTELGKEIKEAFSFDKVLDTDNFLAGFDYLIDEIGKKFNNYEGIVETPQGLEDTLSLLKELAEQYESTGDAMDKALTQQVFLDTLGTLTSINAQTVNFKNNLTDMGDVTRIVEVLTDKLGLVPEKVQDFINKIGEFKGKFAAVEDNLQLANQIAQLADLDVEIERNRSSVTNLSKALADMSIPSELMRGMTGLTEQADAFKKAMSESMSRADTAANVYKLDPENIEAANTAAEEYQHTIDNATSRQKTLNEQLRAFDPSKVDEWAKSNETATEQLVKASIAQASANETMHTYEGTIEAASAMLNQLNNTASRELRLLDQDKVIEARDALESLRKEYEDYDNATEEAKEAVKRNLIEALQELKDQADSLGETNLAKNISSMISVVGNLDGAYDKLAIAHVKLTETTKELEDARERVDYEKTQSDLTATEQAADKAAVALQKLRAGDFKMDTQWVSDLKSAKSDLESLGSSVAQEFQQANESISALSGVADKATTSAKALIDVFAADMGNTDALKLGLESLQESLVASNVKAELLRDTMAQYTPDKIDQTAIAMHTVGANAAQAKAEVDAAFKNLDDAQKRLTSLEKAYEKALSVKADQGELDQYKAAIAAAREDVNKFGIAAEEATKKLDVATATQELVNHRKELAQVDAEYEKLINDAKAMAESLASGGTESFAKRVFGNTDKEIEGLKSAFDTALARLKALTEASKEMPGNTELAKKKQEAHNEAIAAGKVYGDRLKQAMEEVSDSIDPSKVQELMTEFKSLDVAVVETKNEMRLLAQQIAMLDPDKDADEIDRLIAKFDELAEKANTANAALRRQNWGDSFEGVDGAVEKAANGAKDTSSAYEQMFSRITQYAERAASAIVESANTIDAAYRDMRKTVNGTEEDFEHLKDAAIEFSQTHAVSADTILEMEALGGQLGIAQEALESFGRTASNLDIATDINAEDIALQLGQITNVMSDLDFTTFEQFGDALVRLGNNVAAQESSIMSVAQRMSAVANVTSMTTPQLLGWSAAIASTGQRSEAAATAISNTITGIGKAVAAGGDKLEAFANIAQMSADDFKAAWETSSSDALEAFIKGLSTLTDNSTDAIEALDSVGIKAVRQENNILALSQTIDNLDKSITIASDAFNGVSDQWGAAGDAAREADQKSQGFSGTLQILKNNLANLAESFGDALVLPMQLASEAIKGLTTLMNAVPAVPMVVVALTGLVAIGGTTIKTLNDVTAALKNLAAGQAGTAVAGLVTKMEALVASTTGATGAALGLGTALATGIAVTGIGLAVAAIGALATAMIKAHDDAVKLSEAKDRLKTSSERLKAAAAGATSAEKDLADNISAVKMSTEDTAAYINKLAEAQERLAEEFEDQNYSLEVDTSSAEEAFAKIQALMEKADGGVKLNPFDQTELEGAVAVLNETMGTGLEVIDASKAAIKGLGDESAITADKLRAMVDAEIESATRTLLVQQYVEMQQELLKAEDALNKAKKDAAANEKAYADAMKATGSLYANNLVPNTKEAVDANLSYIQTQKTAKESQAGLNEAVVTAQDNYDTAAAAVKELYDRIYSLGASEDSATVDTEKLATEIEKLFGKSDILRECLTKLGQNLDKFDFGKLAEDFAEAGMSTETFANLTDEQLSRIMGNYNGTASSIKRSCQEMGIALGNLVDGMEEVTEASEEMRKATDEEYEHFKDLYDELYTQQKRIREDFYNDEKKRREKSQDELKDQLDHDYTIEKRRLEDIYNDRKSAYDKDYDNAKKSLDKKYDDFKDELDGEYETLKRHLDDQYDVRKDEYDKEYDALKDALGKEYDALKDALDKESDAYKKSLDKQYNDAKKAYDDIYNARKKELDAEYDAVKKILDAEYDAYKKTLDAEYDAAKDSYDAIYNARKKELDAEYNLYKKQLDKQYSARKKELDAEYDAVKDQLDDIYDARKKELDKEYKAEQKASSKFLKQYKKTLTAQTDAFKDATKERVKALEAERDAQKALVDEQTKAKTDELDRRIAELKGETDAENREQRERERAEKKAELQKAVDSAKSRRTRAEAEKALNDYLREIELEDAQERREQLIQELEDEKDALEDRGDMRKEMLDEQYAREVEQYEAARELELEILQEKLDEQYEKMQEAESERLEMLKESHSQILEALKDEQQGQLDLIKEAQSATLEELKEAQSSELEALKESHGTILENLKADNESALGLIKEANDSRLASLKDANTAQLESLKESHDSQLEMLKEEHDAALEALKDENDALIEAMKDDHDAQLETFKDNNDAQLEAMKDEHEAALKVLKRDNEDSLAGLKKEHETRLESMKDENDTALKAMKDDQEAQLLILERENEDGLEAVKRDHEARIDALKEQDEADLLFLKRAHEDELKRIKDNYDETLRGIKDGTISYQEAMAQITGTAVESFDKEAKAVSGVKDEVTNAAGTIKKESGETKTTLLDHLNEVTNILPKTSTDNKNALVKNWNEIGTEVPKQSDKVKDTVTKNSDDENKTLKANSDDETKTLTKDWNTLDTDVTKASNSITKTATSDADERNKDLKSKSDDETQHLTKNWDDLDEKSDKVFNSIKDTETKASDESTKKLKDNSDDTNKTLIKNWDELNDKASDTFGDMADTVDTKMDDIEDSVGNTDLVGAIDGELRDFENAIRGLRTYDWGSELMTNLANGISNSISYVSSVAQNVANTINSYLGHSVPDKGPLHEGGKGEVIWGQDLIENLITGIESREDRLLSLMRDIAHEMEENFDPHLPTDEVERYASLSGMAYRRATSGLDNYVDSIAAAYEAIDRITRGHMEQQVQVVVQGQQMQQQQPVNVSVNVTLTDVTIRETADIDRLAQQLAQRVNQISRSRIGR